MTELNSQLIDAIRNNDLEAAKNLLSKGADVSPDYDHSLWLTARYGRLEIAELLIENGAEVTDNALQTAKANGHTEMVNLLKVAMIKRVLSQEIEKIEKVLTRLKELEEQTK